MHGSPLPRTTPVADCASAWVGIFRVGSDGSALDAMGPPSALGLSQKDNTTDPAVEMSDVRDLEDRSSCPVGGMRFEKRVCPLGIDIGKLGP